STAGTSSTGIAATARSSAGSSATISAGSSTTVSAGSSATIFAGSSAAICAASSGTISVSSSATISDVASGTDGAALCSAMCGASSVSTMWRDSSVTDAASNTGPGGATAAGSPPLAAASAATGVSTGTSTGLACRGHVNSSSYVPSISRGSYAMSSPSMGAPLFCSTHQNGAASGMSSVSSTSALAPGILSPCAGGNVP